MSGPKIETGRCTDVGRRRDHNEDDSTIFQPSATTDRMVFAVADGMGGHLAGEVASRRAVETIEQLLGQPSSGDPAAELRQTLERANAIIWGEAQDDPAKRGMGSTIVCAIVDGTRLQMANVGDSPAYIVADGVVRQLTRDHAWVAEQLETGTLKPEEAEHHPYRHILTRCLGADEAVEVELYDPIELSPGDVVVLCSDGLTEHVRPDEIGLIAAGAATPGTAARELVDLANQRGGSDNITVVVARVAADPSLNVDPNSETLHSMSTNPTLQIVLPDHDPAAEPTPPEQ